MNSGDQVTVNSGAQWRQFGETGLAIDVDQWSMLKATVTYSGAGISDDIQIKVSYIER